MRTSAVVITGCILLLLMTVLPQSMRANKGESQDLLSYMSDHGLVVLNELVDLDMDFTFFAPSKKVLGKRLKGISETEMTEFFEGHIVYNERIFSTDKPLVNGASYTTAKGTKVFVETKVKEGKTKLYVGGHTVLFDNILVGPRGVVHILKGFIEEPPRQKDAEGPAPEAKSATPVNAKQQRVASGQNKGSGSPARRTTPAVGTTGVPKPKGSAKKNPFDERNHYKYRNMNRCSGHGFVGEHDNKCHCASLYTGDKCNQVKDVPFKRIVGHSPIVFNKQKFQGMDEIMVRTKAKVLNMFPKLTPDVKKAIANILPQDDPFHGRVFNVCSLVGSSGSLLYHENGPEIDRSDLVIRFNHAPIALYEKYVGSRTDLRISNGEHLGFNERPNEKTLHHLRAKSFLARVILYNKKFGNDKTPYLVHPGFTEYVANASIPYIASSGYFAILMAMEVCSHVNLYGFHSSFNQGSRHHYFNNEVPANPNRDTSEYERLKKLEDHGLIKFAEPCLHECYGSSSDCETCFGMPMAKVTAMQKLSEKQIKMAENLEKERLSFRQWEGPVKREWQFDEVKGLIKRAPVRSAASGSGSGSGGGRRSGGRRRGRRRRRRGSSRRKSSGPSTSVNVNINMPQVSRADGY
ncbi:sialyltransferase [Chloropicon primus]|uniref:Sialyltransferase n=1 Tax=Chloropicon primus TaxID=1764295 RepID=A0A5B8MKF9_9CHLO|nr:sialyltransferase [Chloropicon primus]UPR00082.1 sialyltransferase [Chloropicon primus]|eukprot:QDZ20869.1 sialyltransferase [Chloropicon primus]